MNNAGIVNNTPDASDELADPIVWDMFASRIVCCVPNPARKDANTTTVKTAIGIDVLMVNPAIRAQS